MTTHPITVEAEHAYPRPVTQSPMASPMPTGFVLNAFNLSLEAPLVTLSKPVTSSCGFGIPSNLGFDGFFEESGDGASSGNSDDVVSFTKWFASRVKC